MLDLVQHLLDVRRGEGMARPRSDSGELAVQIARWLLPARRTESLPDPF
jgi:hypothetical protein